jgi:hypothetical protein
VGILPVLFFLAGLLYYPNTPADALDQNGSWPSCPAQIQSNLNAAKAIPGESAQDRKLKTEQLFTLLTRIHTSGSDAECSAFAQALIGEHEALDGNVDSASRRWQWAQQISNDPSGRVLLANLRSATALAQTSQPARTALSAHVITGDNARRPELKWSTSVVDLMKVMNMDSSREERVRLAQERGFAGDIANSARLNSWLHSQLLVDYAAISKAVAEEE